MEPLKALTDTDPPPFAPCDLCDRWADGLLDGHPMCVDCVDRVVDRLQAVEIHPQPDQLPGLEEWS